MFEDGSMKEKKEILSVRISGGLLFPGYSLVHLPVQYLEIQLMVLLLLSLIILANFYSALKMC